MIKPTLTIVVSLIAASAHAQTSITPSAATSTNPAYLAANCANCHGSKGISTGAMPGLAGLKASYISEQMRAFREGKRPATIMHQLSKGYSDAQIDAIASYFASQPTK